MSYIINCIRGFFMALADSVPGVSGGTIAFILGFYDKFIGSLNGLIYGDKKEKLNSLKFLLKLGIGWIIGMGLASIVLTQLFETKIYIVSSVFLGFIIFAIPYIIREEKKVLKGKYKNLIFSLLGIALVVLITYLNTKINSNGIDVSHLTIILMIQIFLAGMCAISAMVLPGISGSTLLLIFGLYVPIITAVRELIKLNFNYVPVLIIFGLGIITGVILIIKLVKTCLDKHRSATIYFILGLMMGSIYAIIMGPTTLEIPKEPISFSNFSILAFILGGVFILGLERLSLKFKDKE